MSLNTAHASNGVLIHAGEYILLHSDAISMEFSGQDGSAFRGTKQGRIYLTSHRMIFNNKKPGDEMQSFSAPFIALSNVELEQPVFGANYIKGKVRAQPNGNFVGEVKFKLYFKAGGAIEYGQAMLRAAGTAQQNMHQHGMAANDDPPPYMPPGAWHEAPPPAYQPPPGYYGWLPQHDAFTGPPPNTVYVSDNPPPYPGIGSPQYGPPSQPPPPSYGPAVPTGGQQNYLGMQYSVLPGWNAGQQMPPPCYYQNNPPGYNYPPGGPPNMACNSGMPYGPGPTAAPPGGAAGGGAAAPPAGAMGFSAPPANTKEAEAMASAYNTPYNQRGGGGNYPGPSDMPPAYHDLPPNYQDSTRKNQ